MAVGGLNNWMFSQQNEQKARIGTKEWFQSSVGLERPMEISNEGIQNHIEEL